MTALVLKQIENPKEKSFTRTVEQISMLIIVKERLIYGIKDLILYNIKDLV
jgi:hypothetical protein